MILTVFFFFFFLFCENLCRSCNPHSRPRIRRHLEQVASFSASLTATLKALSPLETATATATATLASVHASAATLHDELLNLSLDHPSDVAVALRRAVAVSWEIGRVGAEIRAARTGVDGLLGGYRRRRGKVGWGELTIIIIIFFFFCSSQFFFFVIFLYVVFGGSCAGAWTRSARGARL
jgi:hypothetical protein